MYRYLNDFFNNASWLTSDCSSLDQVFWVPALAGDILSCISPLWCIQMGISKFNVGGNPAMDQCPIQGGVEILPVT